MLRLIGLFFVSTVAASLLVFIDISLPGDFLNQFIGPEFMQMFAAILGFNFAAIIFLLGQLFNIDNSIKDLFSGVKREIKHNAIYLLTSFSISLILLVIRPDLLPNPNYNFMLNKFYYLVNIAIISMFIVALFAVYEILNSAFLLTKKPVSK